MSEVVVGYVELLVNDQLNERWSATDISRVVEKWGIDMNYVILTGIETRVFNAASIFTKFQTPRDRQWVDNEFVVYDGEYNVLTPTVADVENGRFEFATEPILPVYIVTRSYDPYNAAADLLLEEAGHKAGDVSSFSTQNGTFAYGSKSSNFRDQVRAYRKRGRATFSA